MGQGGGTDGVPTPGELARQVQGVLIQFEKLGVRLETNFVRADIFQLYKENVALQMKDQDNAIQQLEDDKRWLTRLVIGTIITAVISVVIAWAVAGGRG